MMKWWGWGAPDVTFSVEDKPNFWPWLRQKLGIEKEIVSTVVDREALCFPPQIRNDAFCEDLRAAIGDDRVADDEEARLHHAYGKSYPNLLNARCGNFPRLPDMIVKPRFHDEVALVVRLAHDHDVCLIPFGGGTNIVGAVDPLVAEERMIVCVDLRDMNRLLEIDYFSMTATLQTGATGPELEAALAAHGVSLGHNPDSFEYSTLGGWLATRSAGMQSDAYGKIEDMVLGMKLVTPVGTITTRDCPATAAGPDLNRIIAGSEGVLGIITEATMRVHPIPVCKDYRGLLFKTFEEGVAGIHECVRQGVGAAMIRLQDSNETEFIFKMKQPANGWQTRVQALIGYVLKRRGYVRPCLMVIGFEGSRKDVARSRTATIRIMKKHGALALGKTVGQSWSREKYNVPYLRDFVMDRGVLCDVAETATSWSNVVALHRKTIDAVEDMFREEQGSFGMIGCHISHTYESGASLYFTYGAEQERGQELQQYRRYKQRITDLFVENSGTLTHHHGVGSEHLPWMQQEISETGVRALGALKRELDPKNIMNPGKLIPGFEAPPASKTAPSDFTFDGRARVAH